MLVSFQCHHFSELPGLVRHSLPTFATTFTFPVYSHRDFRTMATKLQVLAVEIIELIADSLEPADIRSLRSVCRELNRKLLTRFSIKHFASVRTDLSPKSLQRLQGMSEIEYIAQHVKDLNIYCLNGLPHRGYLWHRHPLGRVNRPLVGSEVLREILINKFTKCKSFSISSSDMYQLPDRSNVDIPGDPLAVILSIGAGSELAVKSFINLCSAGQTGRLETHRLPNSFHYHSQFRAAWNDLETLVLGSLMTHCQLSDTLDMISYAPRLRHLILLYQEGKSSFMECLSFVHSLSVLEELYLHRPHVAMKTLLRLLLRTRHTLHRLILDHVIMEDDGAWVTVLEHLKGEYPRLVVFKVKQLRERALHVHFGHFEDAQVVPGSEYRSGRNNRLRSCSRMLEHLEKPIALKYQGAEENVVDISYEGPRVVQLLSVLIERMEMG